MFELFVLAVLCVGGSSAAQSLGPAFAWGDAPLDGFASGQSAVYQRVRASQVAALANNLTQHMEATSGIDLVTVFAGPQVNLRRLALGQPSESDKLLSAQTHSSSNSATFADVTAEGAAWESSLKPTQGSLWVGGSCGQVPSQPLSQLQSALSAEQSRPSMLLLCVQDCAASGCMAEALKTLEQHASSNSLRQAFAYIPSSPVQVELANEVSGLELNAAQRRRLLQQVAASQSSTKILCNAKCQSQVKLYEAFILAATLLSALFTMLACMHMLGTPDRWEKPKDTQSRGQE